MNRWPDIPSRVSVDYLKRLDAEEAGRWWAQPKINGRRRIAWNTAMFNGKKLWNYKAKNKDDCQPMKQDLRDAFEGIAWPSGIGLDMELAGPRHAGMEHSLHVFDLLMLHGEWIGHKPFPARYALLQEIWRDFSPCLTDERVHLVPVFKNPGLVDRYLEQIQDTLSEGLVVRRSDCGMIGSRNHCEKAANLFKVKYRSDVKENP